MFIKKCETRDKKTKVKYISHKLVESYRDLNGVSKHRVIMNLGTLGLPKRRWSELTSILESRISGQSSFLENEADIASLADDIMKHNRFLKTKAQEIVESEAGADMQQVDLNSASSCFNRTLGTELVADTFWGRLGFDAILEECGFNNKQASLAKAVIIGRLINPTSEHGTWRWFQERSALVEMTKVDLDGIGKDNFYEIGDRLLENKEKIEGKLLRIESSLFSNESRIYLYDLTNTYFEGNCKGNAKAKRGHSKEKRADCPLVTLALMVDSEGFPIYSNIYDGNKGEPSTLNDVLAQLEKDAAKHMLSQKPVLIMDRGIATKENISMIIEKGYLYTVISRKDAGKNFLEEFEAIKAYIEIRAKTVMNTAEDTTSSNDLLQEIPVGWEKIEGKQDVYVNKQISDAKCQVLCISSGRAAKEQSMDSLKEKRFIEDIEKLKKSFTKGSISVPTKIAERVGRIKAKYPSASKFYNIVLKISEDNKKVLEISWIKKQLHAQRTTITGCYVIETTQNDLSATEIWKQYMKLTRVESAFQDLKSELGLRPVYHQTGNRTESHLFIGVLAYHLLNSIEYSLKLSGVGFEWNTIKEILSTHQRSTIILKGSKKQIYHIRTSSLPESSHNEIYRALNIKDTLKSKHSCVLQRL